MDWGEVDISFQENESVDVMPVVNKNNPPEEMRAIPGFPGYYITKSGSVWSRGRWGKLKPKTTTLHEGRYVVVLYHYSRPNVGVMCRIARLLLETFVGPCPDGMESLHRNGDSTDDRLENLHWGTRTENVEDMRQHGVMRVGSEHPNAKLTEELVMQIRERHNHGETYASLSAAFGVTVSTIKRIVIRRIWRHVV